MDEPDFDDLLFPYPVDESMIDLPHIAGKYSQQHKNNLK